MVGETSQRLGLHEEIFLFARWSETGTLRWQAGDFRLVLGCAVLAELLLRERAVVEQSTSWLPGESKILRVVDISPTGSPILDAHLRWVRDFPRKAPPQEWALCFANSRLETQVAESLCAKGVVDAEESPLLFVFKQPAYPEIDPRPKERLLRRLEAAIFSDGPTFDERASALVALLWQSGMLGIHVRSKDLRTRRQRLGIVAGAAEASRLATEIIAWAQAMRRVPRAHRIV